MTLSLFPVFFLAGLVRDGLGCLYYQFVSSKEPKKAKAKKAGTTAFSIELFDLFVIMTIAKMGWPLSLGIAYAFGTALGTYLAIMLRRE